MPERNRRILSLSLTLALLGLNLVALNVLISGWSTARMDLTEGGEFSISPATERILQSLDDDLVIHGYFSKRTHPKLAPLVPRIADLLDEYRAHSGGPVKVEMVDPGEDEAAEQEANDRFGVQSTPFRLASKYESGIVNAYFSLVIQYADQYEKYGFDDLIEVEATPDGDVDVRLRNLEYDLTRAIKKVVYGFRNTAELFERMEEPVRFTAIMTPDTLPEIFEDIPQAIRDAAEELTEKSGGRFSYEEIIPVDAAQEDAVARQYGARPMTLGLFGEDTFYLYGLLQVGDRLEQIPLAETSVTQAGVREAIEASLRRGAPGFLKTVGLVTPAAEIPPEVMMQYQMQGMRPPTPPPEFQQVKQFLGQDYKVQDVSLDLGTGVPPEIDLLLVIKPKDLTEQAVYNLDQYLMRGGRVILCAASYATQFSQQGIQVAPVTTGLEDWLEHVGVRIPQELVLDDRNRPLPVPERRSTPLGTLLTWNLAPYPYLVEVADDGLAQPAILGGLESVGIYWGSPVEVDLAEDSGVESQVVLRSSPLSWTSDDLTQVSRLDYQVPEETEPRVLAAALSGRFGSYFAGKEVPGFEEGTMPDAVALQESPETRLLVVGDTEFLSDFVARALGATDAGFFAQNLRFIENAIDWMTLDSDMIAIRSRGASPRRLAQIERGTEVTLETVNYLFPAVVLLAFAVARFWRRQRILPLVGGEIPGEPAPSRSEG